MRRSLTQAQVTENRRAYKNLTHSLSSLPHPDRLKVVSCLRRRFNSAGQTLSASEDALESYRQHYSSQFSNGYNITGHRQVRVDFSVSTTIAESLFDENCVESFLRNAPAGKAPGASGVCAELFHPVASVIAPIVTVMFKAFMTMQVVPSSWTR